MKIIQNALIMFGTGIGGYPMSAFTQLPINLTDPSIVELEFQLLVANGGVAGGNYFMVLDSQNFSRESLIAISAEFHPVRIKKPSGKSLWVKLDGFTESKPTDGGLIVRGLGV